MRCRFILACASGASNKDVAAQLGSAPHAVGRWRQRFVEHRTAGLGDIPRPGGPRTVPDEHVAALVAKTLESTSSQSTVSRICPPERALVFCVDEKSQIQTLDRSQPVLPMMPGVPQRNTHDYVRAGTTALFAALEAATGTVIGSLHRRHRAEEFKKFLIKLDQEALADLDVHLVLDNYATHKSPAIKTWLVAHPRFHLHFTPTGSSWLNLVERWFAELTNKRIRRGVHSSVQALEKDIRTWIAAWNTAPKPYVWIKTADEILERLAGCLSIITDSED